LRERQIVAAEQIDPDGVNGAGAGRRICEEWIKAKGSPFSWRKFTTAVSTVVSVGAFNPYPMHVRSCQDNAPNFPPLIMVCEAGLPGSEQREPSLAIAMVTVLLEVVPQLRTVTGT